MFNAPGADCSAQFDSLERRLAEQEQALTSFRESDQQYRQILEKLPSPFFVCDWKGNYIACNEAAAVFAECTRSELLSRNVRDFIRPGEGDRVLQSHRVFWEKGGVVETEFWVHGRPKILELEIVPAVWHGVDAVLGLGRDITEQRRMEQELNRCRRRMEEIAEQRTAKLAHTVKRLQRDIAERERTERAHRAEQDYSIRVLNGIPAAICVVAPDGITRFVNPAAQQITGYRWEEIVGRNWWQVFYPGEQYRQVDRLFEEFVKGDVRDYEMILTTKDGGKRTIFWNSINRFDEEGGLLEIVGIGNDFSDRIENEERLRHERRLLLELLDLHEKDRRLVAYEIHDGFAQLAAAASMQFLAFQTFEKNEPQSARKAFDQAVHLLDQSVREARRLINGLRPPILDESGVVPALEDLVAEVAEQAGFQIEFIENLQPTRLAPLLETAIFRIVQESLTNARKYSRSDRVSVQLLREAEFIRIEVRDWGVGFDTAGVSETTFGLAGIRERARLLGGEARIDSSPGQGTCVVATLPLVQCTGRP